MSNLIFQYMLYLINVRENQRGNHEWTIQRNGQHWVHRHSRNKQTETRKQQKTKKMSNTDPTKNRG